jgi:hypothetical protein
VIVSGHPVTYLQNPATKERIALPEGALLRRIWVTGHLTYIHTIDSRQRYGWCDLSAKSGWHRYTPSAAAAEPDIKQISGRIEMILNRYNSVYQNLFRYFNARSGTTKSIPNWQIQVNGKRITALLQNSPVADPFPQSLPYLLNEVQQVLLNTGLQLTATAGKIEIR